MIKAILLTKQFGCGAGMFEKGVKSVLGEGKVVKKFTPSERASLGEDVANYIESLSRGSRTNPLDQDTVYFTTFVKDKKAPDGTVVAHERILDIRIPHDKNGCYGKRLSTDPLILEDGTVCEGPLTVDGIKNAIKDLRSSRKQEMDIPIR